MAMRGVVRGDMGMSPLTSILAGLILAGVLFTQLADGNRPVLPLQRSDNT